MRKDRDDEDEDWAEETTEEAQRRRMEEISDHAKNLTLSEDLEKPLEERVDLFYNFVKVSSSVGRLNPPRHLRSRARVNWAGSRCRLLVPVRQ